VEIQTSFDSPLYSCVTELVNVIEIKLYSAMPLAAIRLLEMLTDTAVPIRDFAVMTRERFGGKKI
jgi:hypothetical protein